MIRTAVRVQCDVCGESVKCDERFDSYAAWQACKEIGWTLERTPSRTQAHVCPECTCRSDELRAKRKRKATSIVMGC